MEPPDWRTAFVFGMAGGMMSLALWADYFYMGMEIRWEAVAAIATFAAVLVALYPIWEGNQRRYTSAMVLRTALLAEMTLLYTYLLSKIATAETVIAFADGPASEALDRLVELQPRTEPLSRREQLLLARAIAKCQAVRTAARATGKPAGASRFRVLLGDIGQIGDYFSGVLGEGSMTQRVDAGFQERRARRAAPGETRTPADPT